MLDAIRELKVRAEILHHRIEAREAESLRRLRSLAEYRRASDAALAAAAPEIRRRHALAVIAAELGFPNWTEARNVIAGEGSPADFGALLCPERCAGHFNLWYRSYEEAAAMHTTKGGYLLAYRKHFFVVDRYYIGELGLDPDDRDWEAIGHDWARPKDVAARTRLYAKLLLDPRPPE